jgi:hypothetical protein
VEPRRVPDAATVSRAAARVSHDSGSRERRVPAVRVDPPEFVPELAGVAVAAPVAALRDTPTTLFAGQITGVEGYTESSATGLLAGINLARMLAGEEPVIPPPTTMLGALYRYLREADPKHFQPMNANFGLVDDLPENIRDKRVKREKIAERALAELGSWVQQSGIVAAGVGA